jgi:hypothetical protein
MRKGTQSIKKILICESRDCILKDNKWFNKLSVFKILTIKYYPKIYHKHILKNILKKNLEVRRIINWTSIIAELYDKGYLEDEIFKS